LDSVEPYLQSGQFKLIATVGRERFPTIPDVPALEEIYPGISMEGWFALLGPAGMSQDVVKDLNEVTNAFLKEPETQKRIIALGSISHGTKMPNEVDGYIRSESDRWGKVLASVGIQPQ
jgi:tripartite-type tricarboxylate transporter receptor subunit TctC